MVVIIISYNTIYIFTVHDMKLLVYVAMILIIYIIWFSIHTLIWYALCDNFRYIYFVLYKYFIKLMIILK